MAYKIALTFNERHPVCVEDLKLTSLMMNGPVNIVQPGLINQTFQSTYHYRSKTLNGKMNVTALRNKSRKTDTEYIVTEL